MALLPAGSVDNFPTTTRYQKLICLEVREPIAACSPKRVEFVLSSIREIAIK
jgi:hypothetical protein